jgi:hypothetical protein
MNQQHLLAGAPAAFAKSFNQLAANRDVALAIGPISFNDGKLACVVRESSRAANSPGSLIEVKVATLTVKAADKLLQDLQAVNPLWRVEAVFAAKGEDAKSSVLIVASLCQP